MSLEGRQNTGRYNATFYYLATAGAAWSQVKFTDYLGEQFESMHIKLTCDAQSVQYSFDPNGVPAAGRRVAGVLISGESIEMLDKHADEIYLQRVGGVNATVRVYAWR